MGIYRNRIAEISLSTNKDELITNLINWISEAECGEFLDNNYPDYEEEEDEQMIEDNIYDLWENNCMDRYNILKILIQKYQKIPIQNIMEEIDKGLEKYGIY